MIIKLYLTCESDGVYAEHNDERRLIKSENEIAEFAHEICVTNDGNPDECDLIVLCSSSLDFPEEYTDKKEVIELCRKIRLS